MSDYKVKFDAAYQDSRENWRQYAESAKNAVASLIDAVRVAFALGPKDVELDDIAKIEETERFLDHRHIKCGTNTEPQFILKVTNEVVNDDNTKRVVTKIKIHMTLGDDNKWRLNASQRASFVWPDQSDAFIGDIAAIVTATHREAGHDAAIPPLNTRR